MRLDDQRRSTNVEYRTGRGGGGGGGLRGLPLVGRLPLPVLIGVGLLALAFHFLAPASLRATVYGQIFGGGTNLAGDPNAAAPGGASCPAGQEQSCAFLEAVLGSTEDVWGPIFAQGALPSYGVSPGAYQQPRLVVFFGDAVDTGGCGTAPSSAGPFYCPGDNQLYINPSFYDVMARQLNAPGDFAQAYVIAHEVGHHIQNLIGATRAVDAARGGPQGNQMSVRLELQADCLAGVWGHSAQANLAIDDADLREALNAAHAIGDDTLQRGSRGYTDENSFTHGTSDQRTRWFRRGFESGDARQCDTFAVRGQP